MLIILEICITFDIIRNTRNFALITLGSGMNNQIETSRNKNLARTNQIGDLSWQKTFHFLVYRIQSASVEQ